MKNWYAKTTTSDQGLVIDEDTGETIAVTYKAENAPIVAATPRLLKALVNLLEDVEYAQPQIKPGLIGKIQVRKARELVDELTNGG